MRKWIPLLTAALFACSATALYAQSQARPIPKDAKPVEDVPPPPQVKDEAPKDAKDATGATSGKSDKSDKSNKAPEPIVTTRTEGDKKVEEFRVNGKLYKMKVTPAKGAPYYLIDERGEGNFVRVDGPEPKVTVPMWVLFSW